jgi:putative metallohydrolase (TIGR04338 family)
MIALGSAPAPSTPADRKAAGQQDNVYAAERTLNHGTKFESLSDVQDYLDSLTSSDNWFATHVIRIEVDRIRSTKFAGCGREGAEGGGILGLTVDGQNQLSVLHEVAHVISPEGSGHGPVWVQNYSRLVYLFMGPKGYEALYNAFQVKGVLFD